MLVACLSKPQVPSFKADVAELRLDLFENITYGHIQQIRQQISMMPVIFTLRKASQGGKFKGTESERLDFLMELMTLQPNFVDLEYDTDPKFIEKIANQFPRIKIILSYHNYENTPEDLASILAVMKRQRYVHAYKIATTARSTVDALRMLHFIKQHKQDRITGLCMGNFGTITRILSSVFGNYMTYASPNKEDRIAPCQLTIDELCSIYHFYSLCSLTAVYGLIGDPVEKSPSHLTHNAIIRQYKWMAVYVKMVVLPEELPSILMWAKKCGFAGLSVTIPLKELLAPFLDYIDTTAQEIGAVNTIIFKDDKLYGFNTDAKGALNALEEKSTIKDKDIVLLGAGGTARAIAYEARQRGANVRILNRTKDRAEKLSHKFNCHFGSLDELCERPFSIIINSTPIFPEIDCSALHAETTAMDIQIRPKNTLFLQEAEKRGCKLVYGYEMFIQQALGQFRLWFGQEISKPFLEKYCLKCIDQDK